MKIRRDDTVKVISGKYKGKVGVVKQVSIEKNKVLVEGVNVVKKHQKPNQMGQGGIIEKEAFIDASNVMLVDDNGKTFKVGKKVTEDFILQPSIQSRVPVS